MTQTTENFNERNYKQQTTYYSLTQKYLNGRCNQPQDVNYVALKYIIIIEQLQNTCNRF